MSPREQPKASVSVEATVCVRDVPSRLAPPLVDFLRTLNEELDAQAMTEIIPAT